MGNRQLLEKQIEWQLLLGTIIKETRSMKLLLLLGPPACIIYTASQSVILVPALYGAMDEAPLAVWPHDYIIISMAFGESIGSCLFFLKWTHFLLCLMLTFSILTKLFVVHCSSH